MFIARATSGFPAYAALLRDFPPERAEAEAGVPADLIGDAAAWAAWDGVGEHVSRSMLVSAGSMSAVLGMNSAGHSANNLSPVQRMDHTPQLV